ncbi:hypothetical protein J132_04835 [Termitomyces sp. J132]|nr:hypothetical protein J132_04835 [Termitomyces sp. J132]
MPTSPADDELEVEPGENNSSNRPIRDVGPKEQDGPEKLPLELWLSIFSHLQLGDLRSSTLTCSAFRWLAQPLLFTVLDVSPFFLAYHMNHRILRPRKYLDRTVERLQFYCSVHIAPAVRHCWISPYSRSGFPPRNARDYLDPELVIDTVVNALSFFPNLRILSWHCIDFSERWWDSVHRLPIEVLWINSCTFTGSQLRCLPVRHLDLDQWAWRGVVTNQPSVHELHSSGVSRDVLSLVLHPEHIQHISVPRSDTCVRLLSTMIMMDPFVSLLVLRIPFSVTYSAEFKETLINCPSLEELRIFTPMDTSNEDIRDIQMIRLPSSALRSLSVFEGPYTLLATFGEGRPLKNAVLWGLDESSSHCDPSKLASTLHQFSLLNNNLLVLRTSVSFITLELLTAISSFPILKSLEMTSIDSPRVLEPLITESNQRGDASRVAFLYDILRSIQLPPSIESLRIFTQLGPGSVNILTQEREAMEFDTDALIGRALIHIYLVGNGPRFILMKKYHISICSACALGYKLEWRQQDHMESSHVDASGLQSIL